MRRKSTGYLFIVSLQGGEDHRVKLCFETSEATSYPLEAHDRKEMEISSKHLLKIHSVPGTPIWCFIFHS